MNITDICFADDLLLFASGDKISVKLMMGRFQVFSDSSGLKVNNLKCNVYCGGIIRDLTVNECLPLIEKFVHKIKHWSAKFLSYAVDSNSLRVFFLGFLHIGCKYLFCLKKS